MSKWNEQKVLEIAGIMHDYSVALTDLCLDNNITEEVKIMQFKMLSRVVETQVEIIVQTPTK